MYKLIKIYHLNSLYKHYKNICDCNITFKRINDIIKKIKYNFME